MVFVFLRGPGLVDPAVDPATSVTLIYLSIYTQCDVMYVVYVMYVTCV